MEKFKFKRLNYKPGEALVFHPNLLHGGSDNLGSNTRISLDTRVLNLKDLNINNCKTNEETIFIFFGNFLFSYYCFRYNVFQFIFSPKKM